MRTHLLFSGVLLLVGSLSVPAEAGGRRALLVGSSRGDATELPLRHTGEDLGRMKEVLLQFGRMQPSDIEVLEDVSAAAVVARLEALAKSAEERSDSLFFYYSGHGDSESLHLGGSRLPLETLHARLAKIPSHLRIAILDACQSGGALRRKGVRAKTAELRFEVLSPTTEGLALLSSSAADEASFESSATQGALFSLHLTSGLRGAADENADGQVTLVEAARYAYAQTVRSTLHAESGPQHPMFRWDFVGRADPVLTWIGGAASLSFSGDSEREYVLFDNTETYVVAEVKAATGQEPRVALAPGTYVIRQRSERSAKVARVELRAGDRRVLAEHQMREVPLLRLAQKGGLGERWFTAAAGVFASSAWQGYDLQLAAGLEWERSKWLLGAEVQFTQLSEFVITPGGGVDVRETVLRPTLYALASARWSNLSLRIGPAVSGGWVRQAVRGDPVRNSVMANVGPRLRLDFTPHPRFGVFAYAQPSLAVGRYAELPAEVGGTPAERWTAYGIAEVMAGTRVTW